MGRAPTIDDVLLVDDGKGGKTPVARWQLIVDRIRAGIPIEPAVESTGTGLSTFYRWQERGRDRVEDRKPKRAEPRYREFVDAVTRARAEAEALHVSYITKAAAEDWRASAWYLERTRSERYRRRDTVHQAGPADGDPVPSPTRVEHTFADDAPSKLADLLELVEKAGRGAPAGPGGESPS
jgi:hypothetical protein